MRLMIKNISIAHLIVKCVTRKKKLKIKEVKAVQNQKNIDTAVILKAIVLKNFKIKKKS